MSEEKRGPGRPKKQDTVKVVVQRDYWDAEGARHRKGLIQDVPVDEAFDGIESGQLKRFKD